MSRLARSIPERSKPGCADRMTSAERELSAFFNAVTRLFGSKQAQLSAEDWLSELSRIEGLPTSAHEWRSITAKVSTQLASRVSPMSFPAASMNS